MKSPVKFLVTAMMVCLATLLTAPVGLAAETPAAKPGGTPKGVQAQPADPTEETLKRMTAELKLTEEQQKRVKKLLDSNEQKIRELRASTNLTPQEVGAKSREARAASDKQLKEILTAGQYQHWQTILAERGNRRRPEPLPGDEPPPKASHPQAGTGPAESAKSQKMTSRSDTLQSGHFLGR